MLVLEPREGGCMGLEKEGGSIDVSVIRVLRTPRPRDVGGCLSDTDDDKGSSEGPAS